MVLFMKIAPTEKIIEGKTIFFDSNAKGDESCQRIYWLIQHHLVKIGSDESGLNILYQDPTDKRYWELSYPQGHLHGGGPPTLTNISTGMLANTISVLGCQKRIYV